MTNRRTRTQVRADKLAAEVAAEIEALEQQQREMKLALKAKKEALRQAEEAAFTAALLELGRHVAELAGATDSTTAAQLTTEIDRGEIATILGAWIAAESDDDADEPGDDQDADGDIDGDEEAEPAAMIPEPIETPPLYSERGEYAA